MIRKNVKLLTVDNHKTIKGENFKDSYGKPYKTYIMYLSPYKQNSMNVNVCPHASLGCAASCLFKSGMGGMYKHVMNGRINKTEWFLTNRNSFMAKLDKEIGEAIKRHPDNNVIFRLNGTSDIRWEKIKVRDNKNIFELYPDSIFYDYTKNPIRMKLNIPNYSLTFSKSENNDDIAMKLLSKKHNVAIVFKTIPLIYKGFEVINGDISDLRFKDKKGVIVGLKYKNNTAKNANNKIAFITGFAVI